MRSISVELGAKSVDLSKPVRVNPVELLSKHSLQVREERDGLPVIQLQTILKTGDSSGGVPIVVL